MPVSVSTQRDPFRGDRPNRSTPGINLRVPQARVLQALMPDHPEDPPSEWPLLTRAMLGVRAGYTPISGSITRALNGVRAGSSSGPPQTGLIGLVMVEVITLSIDGVSEDNYRITALGKTVFQRYVAENGNNLPPVKDAVTCTNDRYNNKSDK